MKVIGKQTNSRMCFICGMDNPVGLRAQFYNMEDGSVVTPFRFREEHQSFPGRVHGGLVATMIDELGLRALWIQSEERMGVTMSLETKYRKAVPYGELLYGIGRVVRETSKFATIHAQIQDSQGQVLAEGTSKYILLDPQKIAEGVDEHAEMCYLIEDDVKELPL